MTNKLQPLFDNSMELSLSSDKENIVVTFRNYSKPLSNLADLNELFTNNTFTANSVLKQDNSRLILYWGKNLSKRFSFISAVDSDKNTFNYVTEIYAKALKKLVEQLNKA